MNTIFLIIAPSGAGKTTLAGQLEKMYGLQSIQSYTTRPPRYNGETGHTFVSDKEFDELKDMVAYTEFCGNRYCATAEQVENSDLYVIDPKGVEYFRQAYHGDKQIKTIYIRSDASTREKRMTLRAEQGGKPHNEAFDESLARIKNDFFEFREYETGNIVSDFTVTNNNGDDIARVAEKVFTYIRSVIEGGEN